MDGDTSPDELPAEVLEYLESQHTMTLASAAFGFPSAATVVYVNRGITFYVCMRPDSSTARNLEGNPAVAFTIDQYNPDWNKARGIAGNGEAERIDDRDMVNEIVQRFRYKFPFLEDADTSGLVFYAISPVSVEYIDNQQTPRGGEPQALDYQQRVVFNVVRDLPRREIEEISASMEPRSAEAGEVIVRQGDPADRFFIIVEGEVEVTREEDGDVETVSYLGRGQFFGEIAVLMDQPRTVTVTARVPTEMLAMSRETFRSIVSQSFATAIDVAAVIDERLEEQARHRER